MLHQRPPHTGAPVGGEHEITGIGDVGAQTRLIGFEVVGPDEAGRHHRTDDERHGADPGALEHLTGEGR